MGWSANAPDLTTAAMLLMEIIYSRTVVLYMQRLWETHIYKRLIVFYLYGNVTFFTSVTLSHSRFEAQKIQLQLKEPEVEKAEAARKSR